MHDELKFQSFKHKNAFKLKFQSLKQKKNAFTLNAEIVFFIQTAKVFFA
jgi:hypothetical protein